MKNLKYLSLRCINLILLIDLFIYFLSFYFTLMTNKIIQIFINYVNKYTCMGTFYTLHVGVLCCPKLPVTGITQAGNDITDLI